MNLEIENKKVLVCGSTQGIGKATAIALANEGVILTPVSYTHLTLPTICSV